MLVFDQRGKWETPGTTLLSSLSRELKGQLRMITVASISHNLVCTIFLNTVHVRCMSVNYCCKVEY